MKIGQAVITDDKKAVVIKSASERDNTWEDFQKALLAQPAYGVFDLDPTIDYPRQFIGQVAAELGTLRAVTGKQLHGIAHEAVLEKRRYSGLAKPLSVPASRNCS